MLREKGLLGLFFLIFVFGVSGVYSQTESGPLQKELPISVVGRLTLEKHGQEDWLVLNAKDAQTYVIIGNLGEKLKNSLIELGQKNLVSVVGNLSGGSRVTCEQFRHYEYNIKGETELKVDTKCIRYYKLEVTQIIEAKKSDEEMPPPKRDIEEERRMVTAIKYQDQGSLPLITGEIFGKVTSVNLKSPIKTIQITNRDKKSPLKKITLIINAETRIAKKIGEQEPMALSQRALKRGQEVTAVYARGEDKGEALFITITKE